MRIARSVSPRRRNSEPTAKCSSIVCGSTFTTSINASRALSGCSLSRKLRPLKYDVGNARDSVTSCLISMRAASQPSAKKTGNASNHQYSISMCLDQHALGRLPDHARCSYTRGAAQIAFETEDGTFLPDDNAKACH